MNNWKIIKKELSAAAESIDPVCLRSLRRLTRAETYWSKDGQCTSGFSCLFDKMDVMDTKFCDDLLGIKNFRTTEIKSTFVRAHGLV